MSVLRASLAALVALALHLGAAPAAAEVLVSCDFDPTPVGDRVDRGFYVENFPSDRIDSVTLVYIPDSDGSHTIALEARSGSYDGPVIGTDSVTTELTGATEVTFFLDAPVVPGETVTFLQTAEDLPAGADFLFYDTGAAEQGTRCESVTQTNGTSPPLDSHRRDHVGVEILPEPGGAALGGAALAALALLARRRSPRRRAARSAPRLTPGAG